MLEIPSKASRRARVPHLGNFESNAIFGPKLLQFGHDAVSYAWYALSIEAVHHALDQVDLQASTRRLSRTASHVLQVATPRNACHAGLESLCMMITKICALRAVDGMVT